MTNSGTVTAARGDLAGSADLAVRPAGRSPAGTGPAATSPAGSGPSGGAPAGADGSTAESESTLLGIGQASRELGVSVRSLRYYEEMGLLTPSGRTIGGNRRYGPEDLARVRRIRELQGLLGFNLDEVREILAHEDRLARVRQDWAAASLEDRVSLLDEAREVYLNLRGQVESKINSLAAFRDELDARIARTDHLRERA
jgi:DNA-binding transcriptional MerR regulator